MPSDWKPREQEIEFARSVNVDPVAVESDFRSWTARNDYHFANWEAAFHNSIQKCADDEKFQILKLLNGDSNHGQRFNKRETVFDLVANRAPVHGEDGETVLIPTDADFGPRD